MNIKLTFIIALSLLLAACGDEDCPIPSIAVETPSGVIYVSSERDAKIVISMVEEAKKYKKIKVGEIGARDITKSGY
ncbi:hypothetical protein [Microbulbifer sp. THAF38]|uniref:hypothetical protein n=1 Tax=Microbulbifer sp. THAF38 TaxID=2587856 RepID=UPI0012690287|nr:hypothetical protein [Microbulbifer sp. THAF38]QFT57084.1 hypothetical protein FIU95_21265 [Microbulbifer sp. THAF38]